MVQEPFIELNVKANSSIPMKLKQSTAVIKVEMAEGDSVVSSNKKIVTVNQKGKLKAKKKGKAVCTVTVK